MIIDYLLIVCYLTEIKWITVVTRKLLDMYENCNYVKRPICAKQNSIFIKLRTAKANTGCFYVKQK